jgi:hypothetical protein
VRVHAHRGASESFDNVFAHVNHPAASVLRAIMLLQVGCLAAVLQVRGRGSVRRKLALVKRFIEVVVDRQSGQSWDVWRLVFPEVLLKQKGGRLY